MSLIDAALKLRALREQEAARAAARASALDNAARLALDTAVVSDEQRALVDVPGAGRLGLAASAGPEQFGLDAGTLRANAAAQMARDQLGQSFNLADAGLDEHKLAQARGEQAKTLNFMQFAQALAEAKAAGRPLNVWEVMQGNVATGHALTPVDVQGDTVVNRYDTAAPVLGTTAVGQARIGAEQALGTYRTAAAGDETEQTRLHGLQGDALQARLDAIRALPTDVNPLLRVDAAGGKDVFKPERVKVRKPDGTEVWMNATPNLQGGFDYSPALGPDQQPLMVPASSGSGGDDLYARRARYIASTLQIPEDQALNMLLTTKGDSPANAWAKAVRAASQADFGRYARDPEKLKVKALELYGVMYPDLPPPGDGQPAAGPAPRQAQGTPAARPAATPAQPAAAPSPAAVLAQARAAIAQGAPRAAVEARLRSMGVDPGGL